MKLLPSCFLLPLLFSTGITTAEETPEPPATLTFFLRGVECPACVYAVNDSIRQVEGVEDIVDGQDNDFYATVTFDASKASAHRIAQAVTEAFPLHGSPYQAWLRIRIPAYAEKGNEAKVEALLGRWKREVRAEVTDRTTGEIEIFFLPLPDAEEAREENREPDRGWRHERFFRKITAPAPEGLGLELEWVRVE